MNKKIIIFMMSIIVGIILSIAFFAYNVEYSTYPVYPVETPETNKNVESTSLSNIEMRLRSATVKIITPSGGHGSGSLYLYRDKYIVLTAAHVTTEVGLYTLIDEWGEERLGALIYSDKNHDFSILSTSDFTKTKPLRLKIPIYDIRNEIDKPLIFSGYPSSLPLLTNRGSVSGFNDQALIMHSAAWMGSSGSNVFDNSGNFIGILYAISVGNVAGRPTLMEDVIWVTPYYLLDWNVIRQALKPGEENGFKKEVNSIIR